MEVLFVPDRKHIRHERRLQPQTKRKIGQTYEDGFELLKQTVNQDPFQGTRDLAVTLGTTHTSLETGLKSLGLVKKLGRFVPHRLGQLDCDRHVDACTSLFTLYKNTNWLSHLITRGEKRIFFSKLHRKAQRIGIGEQAQDVPKQDLHPKKVSVWWNIYGVVHWQLLYDGALITANLYVQQLRALKAVDIQLLIDGLHVISEGVMTDLLEGNVLWRRCTWTRSSARPEYRLPPALIEELSQELGTVMPPTYSRPLWDIANVKGMCGSERYQVLFALAIISA
ncbi:transposase [Oesophagostomum dentatum]|uniref:Transposase n=1 Tax=Oesophagostomum dentatum TaxID=61180 RepID=A0A0B1S1D4_OESDE|nr:transposase [Oesophagostomum dentatum]